MSRGEHREIQRPGSPVPDLMPGTLRAEWSRLGYYDDRDMYGHFADVAQRSLTRPAVIDDSGTVTYEELLSASHQLANFLVSEGIAPGDVVAIQVENRWEACAIEIAIVAVGAICLPFPAQADRVDSVDVVTALRPQLPALRSVVDIGSSQRAISLTDALARVDDRWWARSIDPNSACRILVTSGTETFPKLIAYSHNALGEPQAAMTRRYNPRDGCRTFVMVPLASGMGSRATFHFMADYCGTIVLSRRFETENILGLIERHRPTHLNLVPSMLQMMFRHKAFVSADLSSVEVVAVAGAPMPPSLNAEISEATGWSIVQSWGCTDGGQVGNDAADDRDRLLHTVGKPSPAISSVRIVDADGENVATGHEGEIWTRGPFSPMCYLNAPELDRRYRTADGWVRTGDIGSLDDVGYLRVTGRKKDIILRGGANISPAEVEDHLAAHPDIIQVACVGAPDAVLGERVCAVVTVRDGATPPTLDELRHFLLTRSVSRKKWPESLLVVDSMPINAAGKIVKRILRETMLRTASA
jgi:acyl-CoA synthetase